MELRTRVVLAGAILGMSMAATAGVNTWSAVGPEGGAVRKIVYNRTTPSTLYMIAEAGFLRSTDSGEHWQLIKSDFFNSPSDLETDPLDPNRVFVVGATSTPALYVSIDAGATLTPLSTLPIFSSGAHLEVSSNGQTMYAASGSRVFRSEDRGNTWQERTPVVNGIGGVTLLSIDPANSDKLYAYAVTASSGDALFVTLNGGTSWNPVPAASAAGQLFEMTFAATTPRRIWLGGTNGLFVSADEGQTFTPVTIPGMFSAPRGIGVNPDNPATVYVGDAYRGVFRTDDSGANWADVTGSLRGPPHTFAVRSTQTQNEVFAGGPYGLAISTAGGTTWALRHTGFLGTRIRDLSADPASDRLYISAEGGGLHYLSGTASTTTPVNNEALLSLAVPGSDFVTAVLAQEGRVFAALGNRIARSTNGGSSWALTGFPLLPGQQAFWMTSSPTNPQLILTGLQTVYRTVDGGANWSPSMLGMPTNAMNERVVVAPSDSQVAYAVPYVIAPLGPAQYFGLYRSGDGGQTWSPANTGIENVVATQYVVDPTNAQVVYLIGAGNKLFKTTNGGGSWVELPLPQGVGGVSLAVDPLHPQIVFAAGTASISRSIDGGVSWETMRESAALPLWVPGKILPDPLRPHVLNVGTFGFGLQQFTVAPDLALDLDAPSGSVTLNTAVSYRFTVSNRGPFHATGTEVTVQVPGNAQGVTFESSQGNCSVLFTTSPSGFHAATCSLGAVRVGTPASVNVRATPPVLGAFRVSATVRSHQPDPAEGNNALAREVTVAEAPPPPPPPPAPAAPSASGGGGGALSALWLLLLGAIVAGAKYWRATSMPLLRAAAARTSGPASPA